MSAQAGNDTRTALEHIRTGVHHSVELGLILGSGLGELAELVEEPVAFDTSTLPGYPHSTVEGHTGRLVFGTLNGVHVVFVQGRLHLYEGHSARECTFPVRLMAQLGARRLIVTNAAGGIRPDFTPGTLMFIRDHLNWTFENAAIGIAEDEKVALRGESPYELDWLRSARKTAGDLGISTREGIYIWNRGPSYETAAEIRAFATLGADAVGMSTVPEVLEAGRLGMKVLGLSTITNPAAGLNTRPLDHEEVLEIGRRVRGDLERLVLALVEKLDWD